MDSQTRSQYAEAGRKKLEEYRRKKAEEKAAAEAAAAQTISAPPPPAAAPAAAVEIEPTTKPAPEDSLSHHYEDPQTTEIENTASWPSPTPGGASAAAAAAAAAATMTAAPWEGGIRSNISELPPPPLSQTTSSSVLPYQPATFPAAAPPPPYEVSSFSSYTNLLADPPLPPPSVDQDHFHHHQPLFEPSNIGEDGTNNATTTNTATTTGFLNNNTTNTNNGKETFATLFGHGGSSKNHATASKEKTMTTHMHLNSPSRSPLSTSPTPSTTLPATTTAAAITTGDDDIATTVTTTGSSNSNKNNSAITNSAIITRPKDFKELQNHIGELTEEKFTLQRCLEQQTALADRLAAENEELTIQVNASGRAIEEARHEVDVRRRELAKARAEIATAMAERDAYEMGAREASERAKTLAIEVVALEEKVLKMKSDQLKMLSEKEKGGGVAAAAAIMAAESKAEAVSSQLSAANKQLEEMKKERELAQQQLVRVEAEVEALRRKREEEQRDAAAAALSAAAVEGTSHSIVSSQQRQEQQTQIQVESAARSTSSVHREEQQQRQTLKHDEGGVKEPLHPPASALIAGEAMIEAENQQQEVLENSDMVPVEIRALLPPAVWTPGAQGLDPSINDLVDRIYEVVGLLESAARKLKSYTDTNGNPVPFKWTPGYVSATLAEAWADVLRTKAQAKYNKSDIPDILPMPTPGPSKSKNFAYTSIRLSSEATGMPVVPTGGDLIQSVQPASVPVPPVANPFATTTSVPVSGARPVPAPVSGARPGVPPSPQQSDELQAKLQQLQKQLEELEALKAELDASKAGGGGTAAGSRRKLLDSGLPGWDPGMLLEKKLDILSTETALLQAKLAENAWKMQGNIGDSLANVGMVGTAAMDAVGRRQDNIRNALDRYRNNAERKAGDLQDLFAEVMDKRAEKRFERLGLGHF